VQINNNGEKMKNRFRIIVLSALILISMILCGCTSDASSDDSTATQTTDDTLPAGTTDADTEKNEPVYFEVSDDGTSYGYVLYNRDGTVAEEMEGCTEKPLISITDTELIRVTLGRETYYYDLDAQIFSETFTDAFCENGTLLACGAEDRIVICDIFDAEGFYKELDSFSHKLSLSEESPFVSCEFIDGGGSVRIVYRSGDDGEEMLECFNITSGTRYVTVDDWKNKKDLISGNERDSVIASLCAYMGTVDYNTGCSLSYTVSGSLMINGTRYYHCECFYVMVGDGGEEKLVPCAEFVISEDWRQRYDCRDSEGELIVYTENNMI